MHHDSYAEIWKVEKTRKMMEMNQVLVSLYIFEWHQCQCRINNESNWHKKETKANGHTTKRNFMNVVYFGTLITKFFFLGIFRFWEEMRTNAFACHRYCLPMKVGKTLWFPITFSMCNILLTISITIRCVLVWVFESVPNTHSRNISNNELFKHGQNCVKGVDFSHFHSIEFAHKHILRASTWRFARKWRLTSN